MGFWDKVATDRFYKDNLLDMLREFGAQTISLDEHNNTIEVGVYPEQYETFRDSVSAKSSEYMDYGQATYKVSKSLGAYDFHDD